MSQHEPIRRLLYSVNEAANQLSISRVTVRKMCADGRIQSVRLGDRRLISCAELERIATTGCGAAQMTTLEA